MSLIRSLAVLSANALILLVLFVGCDSAQVQVVAEFEDSVSPQEFVDVPLKNYYPSHVRCSGENEMFYSVKPTCALTCDRIGEHCPQNPPKVSGCACRPGYHRDGNRFNAKCVPLEHCLRQKCNFRPNEIFKFCSAETSACEPTCGQPADYQCTKQTFACVEECQCEEGFKRDLRTNRCVETHKCPGARCGPNEDYYDCGTSCKDDCPNSGRFCTQQCTPGCYCAKDYKRIGRECYPEYYCKYLNYYQTADPYSL